MNNIILICNIGHSYNIALVYLRLYPTESNQSAVILKFGSVSA